MKQKINKKNISICIGLVIIITVSIVLSIRPDQTSIIDDSEIPMGTPDSISAKDAGLIPNYKSKAYNNGNLLIRALNEYNSIIIDDSYYIGTPTEQLTTRSVEIIGTDDSELIAAENDYTILFDPSELSNFTLKNVKFINNNEDKSLLIVYSGDKTGSKVEDVNIDGCTFSGFISLYRQYGDTSLDPGNVDFGIGRFIFINNKVYNTKLSFIVLRDIPVEYCELRNNSIENFMYNFMSLAIDNGIEYENKLFEYINYLKVDSNTVICDDNWWGDTSSGLYYTFILFEGNEVLYNNNHVEGMKALNDIALYDAYLSARIVNYTNNTWKNNICFDPKKTNNTLMKSKGGGSDSLIRNYSNNTFIVEENFATRVGQPKENLFVYFMSLEMHSDSYIISSNIFDVYDLRFPTSSMLISNFALTNNTIRAQKAMGSLLKVRLNDIFPTESIKINDNIINITSKSIDPFYFIVVVDDRKNSTDVIDQIVVDNNKITAPFGYILYEIEADELILTNNNITDVGDQYSGFAYRGKTNKSTISSNLIVSKNAIDFYEGRQLYGSGIVNESLDIIRYNNSSINNGLSLDTKYNSKIPTTYKRTYQVDTPEGIYEFYYTFALSYNNLGYAEVTFDNNGETKTYRLSEDSHISDGNGQIIKVTDQGENESRNPYSIKFYNANGKAGFYIMNYRNELSEVGIKTISYQ